MSFAGRKGGQKSSELKVGGTWRNHTDEGPRGGRGGALFSEGSRCWDPGWSRGLAARQGGTLGGDMWPLRVSGMIRKMWIMGRSETTKTETDFSRGPLGARLCAEYLHVTSLNQI